MGRLFRSILATLIAFCLSVQPTLVFALPADAVVSGGVAQIATGAGTIDITQASERAVIDWSSFNIGQNESAQFHQLSAAAIALNRIHDAAPSHIDGSLTANGRVWL